LRGVISQQLIRRKDGKGRVAALEIMINTSAVANLLRQGKLDQLENAMQSGAQFGMCTMDSSLMKLYEQAMIGGMEAYQQAINKDKFERIKNS
jgi:twitching motility protein PilT